MSGVQAQCLSCDHEWTTRKPPEEIERPRCGECGAEEDAIRFGADDTQDNTDEAGVLNRVKRRDKRESLLEQIDDLMFRTEETAPADAFVASELQGVHRRLCMLRSELRDAEDVPLDELDEIESYVEGCATEVDEHAEEIAEIERLAETIAELEAERDELEAETEQLEEQLQTVKIKLNNVETEHEALEKERWHARKDWQITIPCKRCGEPMKMKPGSKMHQTAKQVLYNQGWHHTDCPPRNSF